MIHVNQPDPPPFPEPGDKWTDTSAVNRPELAAILEQFTEMERQYDEAIGTLQDMLEVLNSQIDALEKYLRGGSDG